MKATEIRAAAFDLDGTLLNPEREMTRAVIDAIKALEQRGITAIIATGRSYRAMRPFQQLLDIQAPVVCYNGASVYGRSGEKQYAQLLEDEISRRIITLGREAGVHLHGFRDEVLYYEFMNPEIEAYENRIGFSGIQTDFDAIDPLSMTKMMYIHQEPGVLSEIGRKLADEFGHRIHHCFSMPTFYEMMDGRVSKFNALKLVLDELGISPEETLAIGDGHNDIAMLQGVKYGVAMENASKEVRDSVSLQAPGNGRDGAAAFLNEYFQLGLDM